MPELPEVETVKRIVEPQLCGRLIKAVKILNAKVIAHPTAEQFEKALTNQTVSGITRRGKFLTIHFQSGDRLSLHLRMTGELLVMPKDEPLEKHTHIVFSLSDGNELRYADVRRFGRFWFFENCETDNISGQAKLGLEPTDPVLTADYLKAKLGKKRKAIKDCLHDQTVVAGIGNIYSDEILFAAGIYPDERCDALCDSDWERLAEKIPEIILWGISSDEMTAEEYLRVRGREYRNIPLLRVYGRAGQPCSVCQTTLEKITVCGRTSCFCPHCQKKK